MLFSFTKQTMRHALLTTASVLALGVSGAMVNGCGEAPNQGAQEHSTSPREQMEGNGNHMHEGEEPHVDDNAEHGNGDGHDHGGDHAH